MTMMLSSFIAFFDYMNEKGKKSKDLYMSEFSYYSKNNNFSESKNSKRIREDEYSIYNQF